MKCSPGRKFNMLNLGVLDITSPYCSYSCNDDIVENNCCYKSFCKSKCDIKTQLWNGSACSNLCNSVTHDTFNGNNILKEFLLD